MLSLFVGAGLSQGCGLPGWDTLIDRLELSLSKKQSLRVSKAALESYDAITRTRILRSILLDNFNYNLKEALYADEYSLSKTLLKVARCGIERICTYNFDDLLEEAFATEGLSFDSATMGRPTNSNFSGTIIYHVHGMLTSNMTREECQEQQVVFDEIDYNRMYSGPYSWANIVQLSLLARSSCLFFGVSMRDPNLRRLLDVCRDLNFTNRHFAIMRSPRAGNKGRNGTTIRNAINLDLDSLNVEPVWLGDFGDAEDIFVRIRSNKKMRRAPSGEVILASGPRANRISIRVLKDGDSDP